LRHAWPWASASLTNRLTRRWQDACVSLDLPRVSFHALRHTQASILISDGLNVVVISRRLGHKNPSHLFERKRDDTAAARAIETATKGKPGTS
jgi:integrase